MYLIGDFVFDLVGLDIWSNAEFRVQHAQEAPV